MSEEKNMRQEGNSENPAPNSSPTGDKQLPNDESHPQPETSNVKLQITNMEPHAHHLHKAPGHGWRHYVFEFLMLFLAVFCGFLAENWREHIVENNREKQYIRSFYQDLTADEHDLQLNINFLREQTQQADTLQRLMLNINITQPANLIYMYLRNLTRSSAGRLYPNDRTIVQLRNAGGMRLIKNKSTSDSMVDYYRTAEIIQFLTDDGLINKRSLREKYMPLLNAKDFSKVIDTTNEIINVPELLYLRKADPDIINECLIEIDRIKALNLTVARRIERLKGKAGRIKAFIKNEYHLKNE